MRLAVPPRPYAGPLESGRLNDLHHSDRSVLGSAAVDTLQREDWSSEPARLGESWRLHKSDCHPAKEAICRIQSHVFLWELILEINGSQYASKVCRNSEQVLTK